MKVRFSPGILTRCFAFALFALPPITATTAVYQVDPATSYTAIGQVPWESLEAGDTVLIHWRSEPYREKWVICRRGTESAPIVVRGVAGPNGERPVIDGRDATTRTELNYWNEERGVVKIGGASIPPDTTPSWITLEGLEIRSGREPFTFTNDSGSSSAYSGSAASLYVEKGEHITIRDCAFHDSGDGLFVAHGTSDALVEGCHLYDNGLEGSIYRHNSYTEATGITFQYNHYGPLRDGCLGNNLKDRSAGLVVRYNWIENGNRQLDLVDAEDTPVLRDDPRYRTTFVYGNILIEPDGAGNSQIVHYGGDSGNTDWYRKGTLYFYNNTVISTRSGNTTLFRLSTNDESADCRNNIVYTTADGSRLAMLASDGTLNLVSNWFKPGWRDSHSGLTGTITGGETTITGTAPGFADFAAQDFHLVSGSACIDRGEPLNPAVLPAHDVLMQYVKRQTSEARFRDATIDLGAYEFGSPRAAAPSWGRYDRLP